MDYQGNVALELKADTLWSPSSNILAESRIALNLDQIAPTGDLHRKMYLVTIEEVSMTPGEHPSDGYKRIIAEREEQALREAGITPSMARRLKNVS
jgi:hypothetical protein